MPSEDTGGQDKTSLWTPDLELGVPTIDGQHKNLVLRIESLLVALKSKRSMSALRECLHFLEQYTSEHFHTEEHFMSEHGYPGIEDHVEVHEHFKENVSKAGAFIQANPNSDQSLQLVQSMLVNWYVQHIKGIDRKYIKYFKENGII